MGFLEIAAADLATGNMCGDREHRNAAAMAIVKTIDQMHVAGPATAGANREFSGQVRFGPGGKGCRLFMSDVHPINILFDANGVGDAVQRVADDAVDSLDASFGENIDDQLRDFS